MNAKLWACVVTGVLVAHLALLFIIDHWRTYGYRPPKPVVPTFTSSVRTFVDESGRTVKEIKEFTVRTEFVDDATLKKLSPLSHDTEGAP